MHTRVAVLPTVKDTSSRSDDITGVTQNRPWKTIRNFSTRGALAILAAAVLALGQLIYSAPSHASGSLLPHPYAEPGANENRQQSFSGAPHESVDPFSGGLSLSYTDVFIPGNGGLDINLERHYNSNVWFSRPNLYSTPPYPTALLAPTPYGVGWTMGFGRVVKAQTVGNSICETGVTISGHSTNDDAILELPDGSHQILTVSSTGIATFITKNNWLANCAPTNDGLIVYAPNGLKYTMNHIVSSFEPSYLGDVTTNIYFNAWYPTRIEDPRGNTLTITYLPGAQHIGTYALMDKITGSDGRKVDFAYNIDNTLKSITVTPSDGSSGQVWSYLYTPVGDSANHQLLTKVVRPDGLAWKYDYNAGTPGTVGPWALKTITYPYGAIIGYSYLYVDFGGAPFEDPASRYRTVCVQTKTQNGPGIQSGTWNYAYAPGSDAAQNDVTTVTFPGGKEIYTHYGIKRAIALQLANITGDYSAWRFGLLLKKDTYNVTQTTGANLANSTEYTWQAPYSISSEPYGLLSFAVSDNRVFYPQMATRTITRDGTAYTTQYAYEVLTGGVLGVDSRPLRITETGQDTRVTDLTWYPASPQQVWLFDQTIIESVGTDYGLKIYREYDWTNANLRWQSMHGIYHEYTYTVLGDVETDKNGRGIVSTHKNYYRGLPRLDIQQVDNTTNITTSRAVNDTGTVKSQTNGRGYTTNYGYDAMDQLNLIAHPIGDNVGINRVMSGSNYKRTVTRGAYTEDTIYDGFGRVLCVDTYTSGLNPHVTKLIQYDALGRMSFESYPFAGSCPYGVATLPAGDSTTTDVLGRTTRIDHADGTWKKLDYQLNNTVKITDERGKLSTYYYRAYGDPDKDRVLMQVDTPAEGSTVFTRNVLGQIKTVTQGGLARSYTYDPVTNFLLTETNPETGVTTFTRDGVGNMATRRVATSGTTTYKYDGLDRLRYIAYPAPTPAMSYEFDENSNVKRVVSSNISERLYPTYDPNDNLLSEQLTVVDPVLGGSKQFNIGYRYTSLDFLDTITYPSGQTVSFAPDALGRPGKAAPFINQVAYHPTGQPSAIVYANGRTVNTTLTARKWTQRIYADQPGIIDLTYNYDGKANVKSITDAAGSDNLTLDYDGIDRLTTANGPWGLGNIGYDTAGNITSKSLGAESLAYHYPGTSNRLDSITGSQSYNYGYDVYGNVASRNGYTFNYDDASNLRSVAGSATATFNYDANNLRVSSVANGQATYSVYARNGDLLGEYDQTGAQFVIGSRFKEYAYLGGKLVAMRDVAVQTPIANAGTAQTVDEGTTVTLDGTGSTSADGPITAYSWTQIGGPTANLSGANTAKPTFVYRFGANPPASTVLTFKLTVSTVTGVSSSATVNITVNHIAVPPLVTSLLGLAGNSQSGLSWLPVTGVTSAGPVTYNIYWSKTPGVTTTNGTRIQGLTNPYYTNTSLTNGSSYYYIVTAVNSLGESLPSSEVAVAPGTNGWSTPTLLTTLPYSYGSKLLMNPSGKALALWPDTPSSYMLPYQPDIGWGPTQAFPASIPLGNTAMDDSGNLMDAWSSANTLYASRYTSTSGWSTPVDLRMPSGGVPDTAINMYENLIAVDPVGNAVVFWREFCCNGRGQYALKVSHYNSLTNTWDAAPTLLDQGAFTNLTPRQIVLDNAGNAMALWTSAYTITPLNNPSYFYTSHYQASTQTWSPKVNTYVNTYYHALAMSRNGSAIIVYSKVPQLGSNDTFWSQRFDPNTRLWSPEVPVAGIGGAPQLAMDVNGNATAVWSVSKAGGTALYSLRYNAGSGWETVATRIALIGLDSTVIAPPVMDANGNVMLLWGQASGSLASVWASHYVLGSGWSSPNRLLNLTGTNSSPAWALFPALQVGIDSAGNVIALIEDRSKNLPAPGSLWVSHYHWFGAGAPSAKTPPLANAGPPQTVNEGDIVTLDGRGSSDPDGSITSYSWTQVPPTSTAPGPIVALTGATTATPSFTPIVDNALAQSAYPLTFVLTVTDNTGLTSSDTVVINVQHIRRPVLAATSSLNAGNTVAWASTGAASYNLYWSTTPGVTKATGNKITGVTAPYVHTGGTPSTTYYYVITSVYNYVDGLGVIYKTIESIESAEVQATVGVPSSIWGTPFALSTASIPSQTSQLIIDSQDNVMALWSKYDNSTSTYLLYARRYTAMSATWSPAYVIGTCACAYSGVRISSDSAGNVMAVWNDNITLSGVTRAAALASRYDVVNDTWSPPVTIDAGGNAGPPIVANDSAGNAFAAWLEYNSGIYQLYVNHYVSGGTWSGPVLLQTSTNPIYYPAVAMDSIGNAIVAWTDGSSKVFATHYSIGPSPGWGIPVTVQPNGLWPSAPQVVMDAAGNALALWQQYKLQSGLYSTEVYASRYVAGNQWGVPQLLRTESSSGPAIAMNAVGDAVAVWTKNTFPTARRYVAGTWQADEPIQSSPSPILGQSMRVGMDATGHAMVIWQDSNIYVNRYDPRSGWGHEWPLTFDNTRVANPNIAVAPDSHAAVSWISSDVTGATQTLFVSLYTPPPANLPPFANAGSNQTVKTGTLVTLLGSGTDPDGTIAGYAWTQTAGPTVTLSNANSATASFVAPPVSADTLLSFLLTVTDNNGATAFASVKVTVQAVPPPPPPSGTTMSVSTGTGRNTISWNPVPGASFYNLYWSTTPGVTPATGTRITNVTSPYTQSGLTNGTTYYYVVTAVNAGGESVASTQVVGTPLQADGNLNGDGVVDAADVHLAERIALGLIVPSVSQLQHGDINGDGVINAADLARIRRKALGLDNF